MASNNPFIRGSAERNSRNMDSGPGRPKHANYVNVVIGSGDTGGVMSRPFTQGSAPAPQVSASSSGIVANRAHAAHAAGNVPVAGAQGTQAGQPKEKVIPQGSDAHYRQQLRSGFIDLRASYSEKRKPHHTYQRNNALPVQRKGGNVRDQNGGPEGTPVSSARHRDIKPYTRGLRGENRGLYRSNSSLELENLEHMDDDGAGFPLRRDYGSTSSLDIMSNNNNGESFFQLVKGYRHDNVDQRAPAPPQMQDLLKPRSPTEQARIRAMAQATSGNIVRLTQRLDTIPNTPPVSNGSVPSETPDQTDSNNPQGSPKLKSKSQKNKDRKSRHKSMVVESGSGSSGGLFKKFRGKSESANDPDRPDLLTGSGGMDSEQLQEEMLRRKAFLFYDCQSLGVGLSDVIRRRRNQASEIFRNVSTGASAASGGLKSSTPNSQDSDPGDGKTNELVQCCPFFRAELGREEERCVALSRVTAKKQTQHLLGGDRILGDVVGESYQRHPVCNGIAVLDCSHNVRAQSLPTIQAHRGLVVEYFDHGAHYYRTFFHENEHQNFFGIDENVGPVAVSLRRERLGDFVHSADKTTPKAEGSSTLLYQYRVIVRTSELATLRGSIPEDFIPSSSRLSTSRGLPAKDVLEFLLPELNPACLKLGTNTDKTAQQIMKLDEQGITRHYKIGIMYYKPNQILEEDAYNNEFGSKAFNEFLDCIGSRVELNGFTGYRGGLDCKTDSTGTQSLYTQIMDYEIMFHVSTMLPFTPTNRQQLLRKRHIGNDIVTIVFQEPDSQPFTPKAIRSHFQHVFVIVRVHNPDSDNVTYSIAVTRSKEVPPFGPPIPDGAVFKKGPQFAEFLKMKIINAENAVHRSTKFTAMATRTREEYLKDLANNHITTTTLEQSSKTSKFSLTSRKKEKGKTLSVPDVGMHGAIVWTVQLEDFGQNKQLKCYLAMAVNTIVLLEIETQEVVFVVPCKAVIGWSSGVDSLQIYFDHGELISIKTISEYREIREIVSRLKATTLGTETKDMTLRRNSQGQLGFHVHYEGIVSDVEVYGPAWQAGLRSNHRLVEVCKVATATLTHDQMVDLLRTSAQVNVVVIPSQEDGTPRRGVDELRSSHTAFLAQHTVQQPDLDHSSDSGSSRSTVRNHPVPNRSYTDPRFLSGSNINTPGSANYSDLKNISSAYMDLRSGPSSGPSKSHISSISHSHQSSHDSAGSRSSGHGSEGASASMDPYHQRPDNLSSEGFVSGGDSLERGERGGHVRSVGKDVDGDWSGQVRILPAYSKDSPQFGSNGPLSPTQSDVGHWTTNNYESLSGYNNNNTKTSLKGGSKNLSFRNLAPRPYVSPHAKERSSYAENLSMSIREQPGSVYGTSIPTSHTPTNSGDSRASYQASQSQSRQNSVRHLEEYSKEPKRMGGTGSAGVSPQSTLQSSQRQRLEGSPHSSDSNRRGRTLGQGASSENLAASARQRGAGPQRKDSRGNLASSNFEADLKRLINPDISFSEPSDREDQFSTTSSGGGRPRYQQSSKTGNRLLRTLSDESMCGTIPVSPRLRHRPLGRDTSDVIFTTAVPAQVVAMHSPKQYGREQRSPSSHNLSGSTSVLPNSLSTGAISQQHAKSNPSIPLPDPNSGLDWSNLVNTAVKAMQHGSEQGSNPPSDISADYSSASRTKSLKSKDASGPSPRLGATSNHAKAATSISNQSKHDRNEELENRVLHLERELERERRDKEELESEVRRLRQDNVRLQEESQTAAAQLRKFTEWFFQTIDRQ